MRVYNVKLIPNELFINYFFELKRKVWSFRIRQTVSDFACHSMYFFVFYACFFFLSFFSEKRDHTSTCLEVSGKEITRFRCWNPAKRLCRTCLQAGYSDLGIPWRLSAKPWSNGSTWNTKKRSITNPEKKIQAKPKSVNSIFIEGN